MSALARLVTAARDRQQCLTIDDSYEVPDAVELEQAILDAEAEREALLSVIRDIRLAMVLRAGNGPDQLAAALDDRLNSLSVRL